jgi:uncharacterized protein (DUF1778 family)
MGFAVMAIVSARRDVTINLRAPNNLRDLIDRAAAVLGQSRSEFMLDTARQRAENVLLDRQLFTLDDEQYRAFTELLDNPPKPNAELRRLFATQPPWEQ